MALKGISTVRKQQQVSSRSTTGGAGFDRLKDLSQVGERRRDEDAKSSSRCQQHQQKILF